MATNPTIAELAAKLLEDAARFFTTLGDQNADLSVQMTENAQVFQQAGRLLQEAPMGEINGTSHGALAGRLLTDAAKFFDTIAEQNAPIRDQMTENARVYAEIGRLVKVNPQGHLPPGGGADSKSVFGRVKDNE